MSRKHATAARLDWKAIEALGVTRLVCDSREVRPGDGFVAYRGASRDGRDYIGAAIASGARAVLWESTGFRWNPQWRVRNLAVPELRRHAGEIASRLSGRPSSRMWMIGVTGTDGKTSCSQWIAQALNEAGRKCAILGTLGYGMRAPFRPMANTTPDAPWLHAQLAEFARRGTQAVSLEVSSIGLDQHRVAGVEFDVALFTNLSRDHLDYHGTMPRYKEAKARLFAWETLRHAVVNLDDDYGRALARRIRRRGLNVIGYGFGRRNAGRTARVAGSNFASDARGVSFDARTPWGAAHVAGPVLGRYNASNLLGILGVLLASGVTLPKAVDALARLKPIPGRLQRLGGGAKPLVVIDYAHTPAALKQVLLTLRGLLSGSEFKVQGSRLPARRRVAANSEPGTRNPELICVFGCGGDRDRGKRPLMGRVAGRLADRVIVTSDNPRSENPDQIIREIARGVRGASEKPVIVADRRRAIGYAVGSARRGDIVLLAGKGHEDFQEIGGMKHPFSDAAAAREALAACRPGRGDRLLKAKPPEGME